jgi:hypothetical protein
LVLLNLDELITERCNVIIEDLPKSPMEVILHLAS